MTEVITAKASAKAISRKIAQIRTNGDKLNRLIHDTAMDIMRHAQAHGDCSLAQTLVMAMPASMRRKMLIDWFTMFSPINVKDSDKWQANMKQRPKQDVVPFDIDGADAYPFWQLAEDTPEKSYDFKALVEMVTRLGKQINKKIEKGLVPEEDVASAEGIVTVLSGLHFNRVKIAEPTPSNDEKGSEEEHEPLSDKLNVELKNVA